MSVVVAFANQKGGVGKTTCCLNIAGNLARWGNRILIIDSDAQCNASITLLGEDVYQYSADRTISGIYEKNPQPIQSLINNTRIENLDVIPSSLELSAMAMDVMGRFDSGRILETYVKNNINNMYDAVFIDCPPDIGVYTINAFVAANWLIVPMQTEKYAFAGYDKLMEKIAMVQHAGGNIELLGIIATMTDERVRSQKEWLQLLQDFAGEKYLGLVHRASAINETADANALLCERIHRGRPLGDRPYNEFHALSKKIAQLIGVKMGGRQK